MAEIKYAADIKDFYTAAINGNTERLETLAQNTELMQHLITDHGAQIVFATVHYACYRPNEQHLNALRFLAKHSFPFNEIENSWNPSLPHLGHTALHIACGRGCAPVAETLINDCKADLTAPTKAGEPPFHYAVMSKSQELCQLMIKAGIDVNATDVMDQTALHICKDKAIAHLLLEAGADTEARNKYREERKPKDNPFVRKAMQERAGDTPFTGRIALEECGPSSPAK